MSNIDQLKSLASSKLGFARSNQFLVELPTSFNSSGGFLGKIATFLTSGNMGGGNLNLLCSTATLPGKQILTTDRKTGMEFSKVAYGYAVDDVTMSFVALNDYGTRKYFDEWRSQILDEKRQTVAYKNDYAKSVKIHQLRKPIKALGASLGPININIGLGGGSVYSVELLDAFPTTIGQIELNNELDGLVQINVTLSYTNWQTTSSGQGWIQASAGLGSISQFL
jgi:hypothetical protein